MASGTEVLMVDGPPMQPDANAGETGQGAEESAVSQPAEATPVETEPGAEPAEASAEAEPSAEASGEEEAGEAEAAGEAEESAGYPEWLPYEPMKTYPDELLQLAAKQFGVPPEALGQKWAKDLLTRNINSLITDRNAQFAQADAGDKGADGDAEPADAEAAESAGPEKVTLTLPELHETALEIASEIVTPEGAGLYATQLKAGMDALYDATQSGDKEAIGKAQQDIAKTNMAFLLMALRDQNVQGLLGNVVNRQITQFSTNIQETRKAHSEAVTRLGKDPRFQGMKQFVESGNLQAALTNFPELAKKQFVVNGKKLPLNSVENRMEQYKAAMALHRGSKNPPAPVLVKKGMEAGQKKAEQLNNKRELGKLAAGRATGKLPGQKGETTEEYVARMRRQTEINDPLSNAPRD